VINSIRTKILIIVFVFILVIGSLFTAYSIVTTVNYKLLRTEIFQKTVEVEAENLYIFLETHGFEWGTLENNDLDREIISQLEKIKPTENSSCLLYMPQEKNYLFVSKDDIEPADFLFNQESAFTFNKQKYRCFKSSLNNGWRLYVLIPEKEMFTHMTRHNIIFTVIMEIVFALMLVLAYILVSMLINKPIKKLINDVKQIGLGNLDTKIDIKSNDELGQLARTFNKMTSDLKQSLEENVREREEKNRINTELNIAREIQASLLPNSFSAFHDRNEFEIFADMMPAKSVGGDFYDFFLIDNDNLALVIADVSGKGIPASLFMVRARTLINNFSSGKSPKELFDFANKRLCRNNDACIFVTAIFGIYNIPTGKFVFVNAGHNPPLIKKSAGSYEYIKNKPQTFLAVMKDIEFVQEEILLEKGDTLFLYTDGVTEAMNCAKELFGEDRLLDALNKYRDAFPNDLIFNIKKEVDDFACNAEQADDIAMLALHINKDNQNERQISVNADIKNLKRVINFIYAEVKKNNFNAEIQKNIEIAVEEIFSNIVNYAYGHEGGEVKITVSCVNELKITFEDYGCPFNPVEQPEPDFNKPIEKREIGGLGIYMIKKIMDKVEYSRTDDKNILTITKKK